jgi:hypothetical protein
MGDSTTTHTRMTRVARHISSSSGARVQEAHFAPCVLELLAGEPRRSRGEGGRAPLGVAERRFARARPRAHAAVDSTI